MALQDHLNRIDKEIAYLEYEREGYILADQKGLPEHMWKFWVRDYALDKMAEKESVANGEAAQDDSLSIHSLSN